MRRLVLIGGMGSGKSTVSGLFASHGARCLDLDRVGHLVLLEQDVKDTLASEFGAEIIGEDGEVVRSALAKAAFSTPSGTERLNAITHPPLIRLAEDTLAEWDCEGCPMAVIEISAFDGPDGAFSPFAESSEAIIAVTAPVEQRVRRACQRGFDAADVRARIERQPSDDQRVQWARYVIDNSGAPEDLARRVDEVWAQLFAVQEP